MKMITYTNEPLGPMSIIADFLPPPKELHFKGRKAKTMSFPNRTDLDLFTYDTAPYQSRLSQVFESDAPYYPKKK